MTAKTLGPPLYALVCAQIDELLALLSGHHDTEMSKPCPGRAKLGDGTVGATALHTALNYQRMGAFVDAIVRGQPAHDAGDHAHHVARLRGEEVRVEELRDRLSAAADALRPIAELGDDCLSSVPPAGGMRFADGQRTLRQILMSVVTHQDHQVAAIRAALE